MNETIKANELRIGNWVIYSNGSILFKVIGISEFGIDIENEVEKTYIEYDEFEPIQLTEEWLLKFGFVTSERLWDSFSRSNYYLSKKGELCFNLHESKNIFYMYEYRHIEYVHQLQNLYFALTGEELTIKEQ